MITADPATLVNVTQVIRAPREKVFDAFVIPELRKQWWAGGPGNRCTLCEIDARAGGHYRINMMSQGTEHFSSGIFKEVSRPEKLVFTWSVEMGGNNVVDGSVVTILFKALDAKSTEVSLTHELLPDAMREDHANGWKGCFNSLRAYLEDGIGDAQKHFQLIVRAQTTLEKAYRALTTPEGLKGWWTSDCNIAMKEGESSSFRFGKTWKEFRIEKLLPNSEVRWVCTDHSFDPSHNFTKKKEWVGTSVLFQLTEHPKGGTRIHMQHIGFTPQFECYDICEKGWHHFVARSLKQYLETGTGQPFDADTMESCKDAEGKAAKNG